MLYAAALSSPEETDILHEAGADEVYMGLLEDEWRFPYGGHDIISRRQGKANLSSRHQLKTVAEQAQALHMSAYLALNARYTKEQYPYLLRLCEEFASWGGTGIILQDMGLLLCLHDKALPLKLTASLLAVTVNADGVRFMKQLGVSRVVFPRFLKLAEMKQIAAAVPGMEYEFMASGDQCPMIDGLCRSFHGETFEPVPGLLKEAGGSCPTITDFDASFPTFTTFDTSCSAHHLCAGLPRNVHPCAACEMRTMEDAGIRILKFGGRGTPLNTRVRDLVFFSRAGKCTNPEDIQKLYRETYAHDCQCYYPRTEDTAAKDENTANIYTPDMNRIDWHEKDRDSNGIHIIPAGSGECLPDTFQSPILGHCSCPGLFCEAICSLPPEGPLSIMIPPVTPELDPFMTQLLVKIKDRQNIELSLNDWGTLYRCSILKKNGKLQADLTAGVLLSGQDTDPLLSSFYYPQPSRTVFTGDHGDIPASAVWAPPSEMLTRHWRTPSVFAAASLLKTLGITRLELCSQPLPFPEESPGLSVTLIRESIVSVFPCKGNCRNCHSPSIRRGSTAILRSRNLYLAPPAGSGKPPWIDRIISISDECQEQNISGTLLS